LLGFVIRTNRGLRPCCCWGKKMCLGCVMISAYKVDSHRLPYSPTVPPYTPCQAHFLSAHELDRPKEQRKALCLLRSMKNNMVRFATKQAADGMATSTSTYRHVIFKGCIVGCRNQAGLSFFT
jgi:hypothetical protein